MSKKGILSCVAVIMLFPHMVRADVLKLANGGELEGTTEELLFLADGKEHKVLGSDVLSVLISPVARDVLELKNDVKLTGELLTVTFKSLGGVLRFKRKELSEVIIKVAARDGAPQDPAPKDDPGKPDGTGGTSKPSVRDKNPVEPPPLEELPKVDEEKAAAIKEALAKNEQLRKTYHDIVNKKLEETKKEIEDRWKQRTPNLWVRLDPTADVRALDDDFLSVYFEDITLADIEVRIRYLKARLSWIADRLVLRTREEVSRREGYRREQDRLERELRVANATLGKILLKIKAELDQANKTAALTKIALNVVHDKQRYSIVYGGKLLTAEEMEAGFRSVVEKEE